MTSRPHLPLRQTLTMEPEDLSDIVNPVTVGDAATFEHGADGQAVRLNGNVITYAQGPEFYNNSEYTVLFDFQKDVGAATETGRVIYFSGSFVIGVDANGVNATITTSAGNTTLKATGIGVDDADWHQVALTFSGQSGNAILYVDGVEVARATGLEGAVQIGSQSHDFNIGDPFKVGFPGLIDNVAFLRGAITADQAASLAASPGSDDLSNLNSLWQRTDAQPSGDPPTQDPPPADHTNAAPTDITLSNTAIAENAHVGDAVGALAAVDPDSGDTFTYALLNDDGGHFALSGSNLTLAKVVDYETAPTHTITVQVTDSAGNTYAKDLAIDITDVAPSTPADTNSATNGVVEGAPAGTEVGITAFASDVNGGTVTYSLEDNAGGRFAIDANTGVVSVADGSLLDYSVATNHTIVVRASDPSGAHSAAAFDIAVEADPPPEVQTNLAPTDITLSNTAIAEDAHVGDTVGTLAAVDPDSGDTFTYALLDDASGHFALSGNNLTLAQAVDYETPPPRRSPSRLPIPPATPTPKT